MLLSSSSITFNIGGYYNSNANNKNACINASITLSKYNLQAAIVNSTDNISNCTSTLYAR